MKRLWILFAAAAFVMLPAACVTVALWCGAEDTSLIWNHLLTGLMLLPVFLRCLFMPQILCGLNGVYLFYECLCSIGERRVRIGLIAGGASLLILLLSLPGLEMFFLAMMGI